jgi:hypothetical protein
MLVEVDVVRPEVFEASLERAADLVPGTFPRAA